MSDETPIQRVRAEDLGRIERRIVACIGRAGGCLSLSELAREVGTNRQTVRSRLHGLVSMGVLEDTRQGGNRPAYRLAGMLPEEIEMAERKSDLEDTRLPHSAGHSREVSVIHPRSQVPTENEEKVLHFLRNPATQTMIAERFGYGKSRRSEVVRSLLSKGLIRKVSINGRGDEYVRMDVADEDLAAHISVLREVVVAADTSREERVYNLITQPMSSFQLCKLTGLGLASVRTALDALISQGRARSYGKTKGRRYVRADVAELQDEDAQLAP